mgnify:CR=1 FL=1
MGSEAELEILLNTRLPLAEIQDVPTTIETFQNFEELIEWEKRFLTAIFSRTEETARDIAPLFGFILLRLKKHKVAQVVAKIIKLSPLINRVYPVPHTDIPWGIITDWEGVFGQQYENKAPESTLRNTMFYGAIKHYHGTATTSMKGALDFVALQTARYSGMTLITLVGQLTHEYKCPLSELIDVSGYAIALESWEAYSHPF